MRKPGWYLDPQIRGQFRFYDGTKWTFHTSPVRGYLPVSQRPTTAVVEGPSHALHAVLTLFTFWFFGGWAWVWLVVALSNTKRVHYY